MGMATTEQSTADTHAETGVRRRDFTNIAARSFAGVGAATAVVPLANPLNPSADVLAPASSEGHGSGMKPSRDSKPGRPRAPGYITHKHTPQPPTHTTGPQ